MPQPEELTASGELFRSTFSLHDRQGRTVAEFDRLTCKRIRRPESIRDLLLETTDEPQSVAAHPQTPAVPAAGPDWEHVLSSVFVFEDYGELLALLSSSIWAGALLGLVVPGVEVENIGTTAKTLPQFAELWHGLVAGAVTP